MRTSRRHLLAAGVASLLVPGYGIAGGTSSDPVGSQPTASSASVAPRAVFSWPGKKIIHSGVSASARGASPRSVSVHVPSVAKAEREQMHAVSVDDVTLVDHQGMGEAALGIFAPPVTSIGFYRSKSYLSTVIREGGSQNRAVGLAPATAGRL